jgi:hypothetical protein
MANHSVGVVTRSYRAPLGPVGLAKRQGWNDAAAGAPPDRAYVDNDNRLVAMSYERGRLFALNVKASGQKPMRWRTMTSTPVALGKQLDLANRLIGRATPTL